MQGGRAGQGGVPAGYEDIGQGFFMNPNTGQIIDTKTGQSFQNPDEFGQNLSQYESGQPPKEAGNKPTQGSQGMDYASMGNNIRDGYNYITGGASAGSGAASGVGSYSLANTVAPAYGYTAAGAGAAGAGAAGAGAAGYSLGTGALSYTGALAGSGAVGGAGTAAGAGGYSLSGALGSSAFGGAATTGGTAGAGAVGGLGGTTSASTGAASGIGGAATGGILAGALAAYQAGKNYDSAKKASGGALSEDDVGTMTHMFGVPKPLRKYQSWEDNQWWSPAGMTHKLIGETRKGQEGGMRRVGRGVFNKVGLINPESRSIYDLADGTGFDIRDYKTQNQDDAYNIKFDGTEDNDKIGFLNAITAGIIGDKKRKGSDVADGKTRSDLTGELYNAAKSNGQLDVNARNFGDKLGGRDAIYGNVLAQWKNGGITADMRDNYLAAIDKEYGVLNPTNQRWDASLTGKDAERNQKEFANAEKKRQEQAGKNPQAKPMATNMPVNAKPLPFSAPLKPVAQNQSINPRLKGRR